jgi:hypothetical protein
MISAGAFTLRLRYAEAIPAIARNRRPLSGRPGEGTLRET